ncbi:hypothetical protein, partial [Brevibacillus agri]
IPRPSIQEALFSFKAQISSLQEWLLVVLGIFPLYHLFYNEAIDPFAASGTKRYRRPVRSSFAPVARESVETPLSDALPPPK